VPRYTGLKEAYESNHEILNAPKKPNNKPDNRIVVNFPKYIVDTFNGFFIGNPVKVTTDDKAVSERVEFLDQYNDQDNKNVEISKLCSIYGKGYEMYYADENSEACTAYLTPIDAFMIWDDSIIKRALAFVRLYVDHDDVERGSVSNAFGVRYFKVTDGVQFTDEDWQPHNFSAGVPATEFIENEERQGLFEPVMTDINAYNKAISEKANDVDYFADAYLKVLGAKLEKEDLDFLRDNRIINLEGEDAEKIIVEFLSKPSSDDTQENLLNRLERLIFQISMVANISDENFGGSSGTALQYRVLNMSNLMKFKTRKFDSGLYNRYKILFSHPSSSVAEDAWMQLKFSYTQNLPKNLLEESQIAGNIEGVVSKETQLKVLSVVDNVQDELVKIKNEEEEAREDAEKSSFQVLGFGTHPAEQQPEPTEDINGDES
jgi:SPP1 family phage portal protein